MGPSGPEPKRACGGELPGSQAPLFARSQASEQAMLVHEPRDRAPLHASSGRWRRGASLGGEVQLPAVVKTGPGDIVPGNLGQGDGTEELGQMEDFGHSYQVLRVEVRWLTQLLCFLS